MRSSGLAHIFGALLLFALFAPSAGAQTNVVRKTNYYAMTGSSIRHIQESLRQTRPWKDRSRHDASTEWRIQWNAYVGRNSSECYCSSFATTTIIVFTLPRWVPPTNTPPTVRQTWAKYIRALEQHEAGHADIALAATAEMHKRIQEIGSESDCDALRAKIKDECEKILTAHRDREKEYDQQTRHGATQGATLRGQWPGGTNTVGRPPGRGRRSDGTPPPNRL